MLYKYSEWLVL